MSAVTKATTLNREFQDGLSALQAGKPADAERLFKAVLRAEPKHVGALNLLGVVLTQNKRFAEAEDYLRRALQQNSRSDATLYNYGLVLKGLKRPAEALEQFNNALKINSSVAETWNNRGTVLNDLKRYQEAVGDFDGAIGLNPNYAEAYYNKGKSLLALERGDDALAALERALAIKSDLAEAWLCSATVWFRRKEYKNSLEAYDRALAIKADLVEAWLGRGNLFFELKRWTDALTAYNRALALKPDLAEACVGSGKIAFQYKRFDEAFSAYEEALQFDPGLAEAWLGRGTVWFERRKFKEALADYEKALVVNPGLAAAWLGVGNVYLQQKRFDEALTAYEKAEALIPNLAETLLCRGNLFLALKKFDDALAAYNRAQELKPDLPEAWTGRGAALSELEEFDEALAAFDRALVLKPDLAEAWVGRSNISYRHRQYHQALAALDRALELKPDYPEAWSAHAITALLLMQYDETLLSCHKALMLAPDMDCVEGYRMYAKLNLCDWSELEAETAQLLSRLRAGKRVIVPMPLLALPSTPADQLQCARCNVNDLPTFPPIWLGETYSHDRIRIAYLSADFRDHAVAYLTAGLFESHDKSRFEITAISFVPVQDTAIRRRLENAFERFVDAKDMTDGEIANLLRHHEIDIAVDLMGHTQHARLGIFARRPVPIQVFYLGYAGTLGTNFIDYILADSTVIPEELRAFYTEQVVWLPDSYFVSDNRRAISPRAPTRLECGLPEHGFVFCSFNNPYKIAPEIFQLWMRLLHAVPDSVLWLSQAHSRVQTNLRREAERCSVSPRRLVFAPKISENSEHLARQRQADLFLDTLPYNAHTTASDALWAGLPVLTCLGETFAGRVAASLLKAVGLPELITTSLQDYEDLALRLAHDPALLASTRAKLARNRDTYPLFDTARFTRHIEAAYETMWERQQKGQPPQAFAVKRID